jgi:glucose/arabinose dehydrogenase
MKYRHLFSALFLASLPLLCSASENQDGTAVSHTFQSLHGEITATRVSSGLSQPSAIEFLPNGQALVLQRDRGLVTLTDFSTGAAENVSGLPNLVVAGDSGVHDVELHPDFAENGWIYISYSEGEEYHATAVVDRFRLEGGQAQSVQRVLTADAYSEGNYHLAARMAFVDGFLFVALGDREHPPMAQDMSNHAGAVLRLRDDGTVPNDNPFVDVAADVQPRPRPEIWSYGHRDPMGLYRHPKTNELWLHEHGPRAGDEVQMVKRGAN